MALDIGSTVEGTIVKLTEYGAIVRLQGGKTGLIHVSEIADSFVRDVKDYFKEHDHVMVKVLNVNNKGRYELSTKQIEQPVQKLVSPRKQKKLIERPLEAINLGPEQDSHYTETGNPIGNFEERMTRFMRDSQERQLDLKRNIESKRGVKKR